MRRNQGFSIIELMIVVTIIGILAAIALPAYQKYTYRAKASELLVHIDALRGQAAEYAQLNGWPSKLTQHGLNHWPDPIDIPDSNLLVEHMLSFVTNQAGTGVPLLHFGTVESEGQHILDAAYQALPGNLVQSYKPGRQLSVYLFAGDHLPVNSASAAVQPQRHTIYAPTQPSKPTVVVSQTTVASVSSAASVGQPSTSTGGASQPTVPATSTPQSTQPPAVKPPVIPPKPPNANTQPVVSVTPLRGTPISSLPNRCFRGSHTESRLKYGHNGCPRFGEVCGGMWYPGVQCANR